MFDSHAHKGDTRFQDGLVCTSSPEEAPLQYRFSSIGIIPEGGSEDVEKVEYFASIGYHVGEIGLDKRYPDIEKQLRIFKECLRIAKRYNRFVTTHMVGYNNLLYETL